ncbi:hypothetical protein JCGZ_06044 [Jatropha curcas]|uniref:Uncharacterized protein n=1 Tax=Jatropha curcas TaxID=180498 RepID=A0A067J9L3_JATCU|nr:hypothetical protein JCGZ_06044 [Jatropha curcas]
MFENGGDVQQDYRRLRLGPATAGGGGDGGTSSEEEPSSSSYTLNLQSRPKPLYLYLKPAHGTGLAGLMPTQPPVL